MNRVDLIYGVPNDGSEDFYNHHHINGNIVMVDRGGDVPIFDKVQRAQDVRRVVLITVLFNQSTCRLEL